MKRIFLIAVLFTAVCLGSFARKFVAEGNTYSALGKYKIEVDDKSMFINGKEHIPYVITYDNSNLQVRVAVDMERGRKIYYVISDALCVQYESDARHFGVELLSKEVEKDGYKTSESALNKTEYFHQKAITTGYGWRRNNTKLVAAFYPMLLNNTENLVSNL
jgi:hypothetical protein